MNIRTRMLAACSALALVASLSACNDDNENSITGTSNDRVYVQVDKF